MTVQMGTLSGSSTLQAAANFRSWQRDTFDRGLLPVIGVAGGRGKSTVVRMIDAILQKAHLRTAVWTDLGVEIRGKRQRGEISGWATALSRLSEASIDVAIQELDWSTINAVGLPPASYPLLAVTNLMYASERDPDDTHSTTARRAAYRIAGAVHRDGAMVVGGDDPALVDSIRSAECTVAMTALSRDTPTLKRYLQSGGTGVWVERNVIHAGDLDEWSEICLTGEVGATLEGAAQFEVANALVAIAVTTTIGVDPDTIRVALQEFEASAAVLPGSFNAFGHDGYQVIVDRAAPSWHLRHLLRSINPGSRKRQITVLGDLEDLPAADLQEIGRLLGRQSGAIILHSNKSPELVARLRKGIAGNDFPPLVIYLPTERRALNRALKTARADDVVLLLTGADPGPAIRAIQRLVTP